MALPNEIHPFAIAGGGNQYQVANSLRFRASNSAYLSRTPGTNTDNTKWTYSVWTKKTQVGGSYTILGATAGAGAYCMLTWSGDQLYIMQYAAAAFQLQIATNALYRDPAAWYHIVVSWDTTQATSTITGSSTDRVRLYVNGSQITSFAYNTAPSQNSSFYWGNPSYTAVIGYRNYNNDLYYDGYMTEMNFVDGQALGPSSFGQYDSNNIWQPKKYTGTYGNNGFYLPFNDATSTTTLGYDRQLGMSDSSKNNWTLSNISVTSGRDYDSMIDSPTNYNDGSTYYNRGNYCTINPLDGIGSAPPTLSEGNLRSTSIFAGNSGGYSGTIGVTTGKWYFEVEPISNGGYGETFVGILGGGNAGYWCGGPSASYSTYGIYAVAFDVDAGKFWIKLASSGNWASGDPALGTSASTTFTAGSTIRPYIYNNRSTGFNNSGIGVWNFGQRPFNYTPPTGYKALNTYNLADPSLPLV